MFCTSCGKQMKEPGAVCRACAPGAVTKTTVLYCYRCGERVSTTTRIGVFCQGCAPKPKGKQGNYKRRTKVEH